MAAYRDSAELVTLDEALARLAALERRSGAVAGGAMTVGEVARAKRRALARFDAWLRVTGCLDGSSYQWELEGLIEDAVECGIQAALGIYRPLDEEDDAEREGARLRGNR